MKKTLLTASILGASIINSTFALTTAEIVAQAKPAVVTIIQVGSSGNGIADATGWFSDSNTVVTNAHVLKGNYSALKVQSIDGSRQFTIDHINWMDTQSDVAVFTVKEESSSFLTVTNLSVVEGQDIVVIGNPEGHYGTVTTGIVSALRSNLMQISAPISPGSSGSPVLNYNGEVVGMVKAEYVAEEAHDLNYAVLLVSLKYDLTMAKGSNIGGPISEASGPDLGKYRPTQFGKTYTDNGNSYTPVTSGTDAWKAIVAPAIFYLVDTCDNSKRNQLYGYFFKTVDYYFGSKNVNLEDVIKDENMWASRFTSVARQIDFNGIKVERVDKYNDTYMVAIPLTYTFKVKNKKAITGKEVIAAVIALGQRANGDFAYFISGVWNPAEAKS
jgi:hypothetical protein